MIAETSVDLDGEVFLTDPQQWNEQIAEEIDMPPIPEFIVLIADSGAQLYACKASVDMFGLTMEDFVPQVEDIISVGEFYEKGPAARSSSPSD